METLTPTAYKVDLKLKRVHLQDLNLERLVSFREAITDFVERSKTPQHTVEGIWKLCTEIIAGRMLCELWWVLDGDTIIGYFVTSIINELSGAPSLCINQGWAHRDAGIETSRFYLEKIVEDAMKRGASRVWFMTRRDEKAYGRWLGSKWKAAGTFFERR